MSRSSSDDLRELWLPFLADAYVTGNGDLLWEQRAVPAIVSSLVAAGVAILGGEVYGHVGPMYTSFDRDWATTPAWGAEEAWDDFVRRGARQAIEAADPERAPPDVRYYLAVCRERAYPFKRA